MNTPTLLWQYVHDRSDAAFEQIVRQHAGLVYSSAMRRTQTASLAEEVSQQVFCDLARKAKDLPGDVILSGWLYRHTGFTAAKLMRGEARRARREAKAAEMMMTDTSNETDRDTAWSRLAPHLEAAMDSLSAKDRQVILLRYFEEHSLGRVGEILGISEEASRKRVQRALAKMQQSLCRRGVQTTASVLAVSLTGKAVEAAPQGLVEQVLDRTSISRCTPSLTPNSIMISMPKLILTGTVVAIITAIVAIAVARINQQPAHEVNAPPNASPSIIAGHERITPPVVVDAANTSPTLDIFPELTDELIEKVRSCTGLIRGDGGVGACEDPDFITAAERQRLIAITRDM